MVSPELLSPELWEQDGPARVTYCVPGTLCPRNSEAANLGSQAALGQELTSSEPRVLGSNAWLFRRPPVEPVIPGRDRSPRNWDRVRGVTREPAQCRRASRERAGG